MVTGLEAAAEAVAWAFNVCLHDTNLHWDKYPSNYVSSNYVNKMLVNRLYGLLDLYEVIAPCDGYKAPYLKGNRITVDALAAKTE